MLLLQNSINFVLLLQMPQIHTKRQILNGDIPQVALRFRILDQFIIYAV